jgi:hypothetical protein
MDTIRIGTDERPLRDADAEWIGHEISGRRKDGQSVCVFVTLRHGGIDLRLATPTCGGGPGSGRQLNPREQAIVDLWKQCGLNDSDFSVEGVIRFVRNVSR